MEPGASFVEQDVSAVQGGASNWIYIERRQALSFERAEPRWHIMAYLRGLLIPATRRRSWQLAELSSKATPYGFQHLLRRAWWVPEAVSDELRHYALQHLRDSEAVLMLDETGFLKKGRHSAD